MYIYIHKINVINAFKCVFLFSTMLSIFMISFVPLEYFQILMRLYILMTLITLIIPHKKKKLSSYKPRKLEILTNQGEGIAFIIKLHRTLSNIGGIPVVSRDTYNGKANVMSVVFPDCIFFLRTLLHQFQQLFLDSGQFFHPRIKKIRITF